MIQDRELITSALPGYDVGAELGRGGWGAVLAGRHRQLGRDVAIKQLPPAFARDPAVRARFVSEARILASLDHPHVVPIYDYVERDDVCLLVMENLPGGTVWRQFTTTGLTMPSVCAIAMATCSGLHSAHQQGILHRDVKPENLMFSASRTLKVTDFGISKVMSGSETKATKAGEVLGTPAYMAPEQVQNRDLTPATDVYAVGMMLYELLSGRLPFPTDDPIALLFCQINDQPPPLAQAAPKVPRPVADVTMKALAKNPTDRYASAEDLGVAIGEAATEAWGPGWLQQSDSPVMGTGRIAAVTQQAMGTGAQQAVTGSAGPAPSTLMTGGVTTPTADAPPSTSPEATATPAAATAMPSMPTPPAPATPTQEAARSSAVVRPEGTDSHVRGAVAADLAESDLVGIQEVVKLPPLPTAQIFTALALLLVCVAVAFIGLGSPRAKTGNIAPATVTVNGIDPVTVGGIPLNLAQPVVVAGKVPPGAASADQVKLSFYVGPAPVGEAHSSLTPTPAGRPFSAPLALSGFRYLIASRTSADLQFTAAGQTVAHRVFQIRSKQSSFLTVPGALAIALLLFTLAYIESLMRSLRRRRKRVVGPAGLLIMGAIVGIIAVIWAWLAVSVEPTTTTMVACAVLGAGGGLAAALAAMRMGQRYRMRRGRRVDAT